MSRPSGAPKALVVDDLAINRLLLGTILNKLGFEVLEAENGLQCIDVYNQERAELACVFLDLQMPIADGWAATKGMRALDLEMESRAPAACGHGRVPVVVCTAACLDELVENGQTVAQRALSLGANGAVRKPLNAFTVLRILDEYAPQWRGSAEHAGAASPPSPLPPVGARAHTTTQSPSATPAAAATSPSHGAAPPPGCRGAPAVGQPQPPTHPCRHHCSSSSSSDGSYKLPPPTYHQQKQQKLEHADHRDARLQCAGVQLHLCARTGTASCGEQHIGSTRQAVTACDAVPLHAGTEETVA